MNAQGELLSDVFHLLAQPIVAMRATVELALMKPLDESEARQTLERCLQLLDRLTQEVALARELASLDEYPPRARCDAGQVLHEIVEEMAPVAEEGEVTMELRLDAGTLWCSEAFLRRALFPVLDSTLSGVPAGGRLTIQLLQAEEGCRLEIRPGVAPGARRELCRRLLQSSGGSAVKFDERCSLAAFQTREPPRQSKISSGTHTKATPKGPSRVARGRKLETGS